MSLLVSSGCHNEKYHRLSGLTVLEARKSKIKMPANSVSGEGSHSSQQMANFLLLLYTVAGDRVERKRETDLLIRSFCIRH